MQALANAEKVNTRECDLTHEVMLWVVIAMGLFTDLPIGRSLRLHESSA